MSYKNIQGFIRKLESENELKRISAEVDSVLEVTEIADRMSKIYGPALLFEKIKGSTFPLLINAFGSFRRMQMALGCDSFDDIGRRNGIIQHGYPRIAVSVSLARTENDGCTVARYGEGIRFLTPELAFPTWKVHMIMQSLILHLVRFLG